MNVILTKGIMGSGKTSWAKKYIIEHSNWKRVSRDDIIKKELYKKEIEPRYNVLFVFDDRPQVLKMWQNELGLFTFNVNQDVDCLNDF